MIGAFPARRLPNGRRRAASAAFFLTIETSRYFAASAETNDEPFGVRTPVLSS
jgi:hypothetical protein